MTNSQQDLNNLDETIRTLISDNKHHQVIIDRDTERIQSSTDSLYQRIKNLQTQIERHEENQIAHDNIL